MKVVDDLLAAISADPSDEAPQLVIADALIAEGDPRGELIVLDHRERAGELHDPAGLEQLLLLAAEYSFPRANDVPESMLPFVHVPAERSYTLDHENSRYTLLARGRTSLLTRESLVPVPPPPHYNPNFGYDWPTYGYPERFDFYWSELEDHWTPDETRVILTLFSDALRAGSPIDELRFPFQPLPLPAYDGGPLRCYMLPLEFLLPRDLMRNRYGLAARDYHRWHRIWQRLRASK